jgi:hypothetical protein
VLRNEPFNISPDSPWAKLRDCTLNARFKDCSTISEIRHLSKMSCKKTGDILKYVFNATVRDEIQPIGKDREEFDKENSYFSYTKELKLS